MRCKKLYVLNRYCKLVSTLLLYVVCLDGTIQVVWLWSILKWIIIGGFFNCKMHLDVVFLSFVKCIWCSRRHWVLWLVFSPCFNCDCCANIFFFFFNLRLSGIVYGLILHLLVILSLCACLPQWISSWQNQKNDEQNFLALNLSICMELVLCH
jgi:hypothetical protein